MLWLPRLTGVYKKMIMEVVPIIENVYAPSVTYSKEIGPVLCCCRGLLRSPAFSQSTLEGRLDQKVEKHFFPREAPSKRNIARGTTDPEINSVTGLNLATT